MLEGTGGGVGSDHLRRSHGSITGECGSCELEQHMVARAVATLCASLTFIMHIEIMNNADDFVGDTMDGIIAAYGDKVSLLNDDFHVLLSGSEVK